MGSAAGQQAKCQGSICCQAAGEHQECRAPWTRSDRAGVGSTVGLQTRCQGSIWRTFRRSAGEVGAGGTLQGNGQALGQHSPACKCHTPCYECSQTVCSLHTTYSPHLTAGRLPF